MNSLYHGDINQFINWYDTDGNIINASDGGIIEANGKYYWYGLAFRNLPMMSGPNGGQMTDIGVLMYSSTDLIAWDYEGVILEVSSDPESELYGPLRFERPKIIYNDKTKMFVLWCHFVKYPGDHGVGSGTADMGLAVCDRVNGKYKWLGYTRPIDQNGWVRDMTVYKDFDGQAYLIYDRHTPDPALKDNVRGGNEDRCLYVVKLSPDYLSFTNEYKRIDAARFREAPVVVFKNGYYYIVTSGLTGWETNRALAFRTRHLLDEWESIGNPCIDDFADNTFNTQGSNAFLLNGVQYIMLERHNTKCFLESSYVWLPVEFNNDNTISLHYKKEFKPY